MSSSFKASVAYMRPTLSIPYQPVMGFSAASMLPELRCLTVQLIDPPLTGCMQSGDRALEITWSITSLENGRNESAVTVTRIKCCGVTTGPADPAILKICSKNWQAVRLSDRGRQTNWRPGGGGGGTLPRFATDHVTLSCSFASDLSRE